MSRFLGRAATAAACVAIVLLVVLLVVIWTGVRSGSISGGLKYPDLKNETDTTPQGHGLRKEPDRSQAPEIVSEPSMMFERPLHRFDVKSKNPWEAENATNEVGSQSAEDMEGHGLPIEEFAQHVSADEVRFEHIFPKKIHQNIYEDPADSVTATRHHTGHFRHATAEIWDPHPQYEFKAFGKDFHLLLTQDIGFVSPDIKVIHVGENSTRREHPGHQLGCFYSGTVKGDPKSVVSVSLCHGMTGHIRTSTGNYFIEPADRQRLGQGSTDKPVLHVIYPASTTRSNSNSVNLPDDRTLEHDCGLIDNSDDDLAPAPLTDDASGSKIDVGEHLRQRRSISRKSSIDESVEDYSEVDEFRRENLRQFVRHDQRRQFIRRHERPINRYYPAERRNYPIQKYQEPKYPNPFETWRPRRAVPQEYFIEVMVVADAKMADYHGEGLFNYILVLMSTVSRIYKDPSIGNAISIAVVKITKTDKTFGDIYSDSAGIAANDMLKKFCLWQKHINHPNIESPEHHDAALLLTRENLCHNAAEKRCDTLGLAELGRMCVPKASCAIVQDNGLAAAFTIAHEIGHVLSMPHDDDTKCRKFSGNTRIHNVMSRMLDDKTFPWEWSNCSRHYVTEFLDSGYGNCLLDEPNTMTPYSHSVRLPGEDYSENKQCELVFGLGSKICPYMVSDVCRRLWCTAPVWDQEQQCHTQHMPWADGTACDHGKWCQRGECVSRQNLRPVDGQWGPWESYGACSRTCGGGIRKKYRSCNNPQPQNGGNYCVGARVKFRSCGTKDCPSSDQDFREEQCANFNNNNMNIRNLERNVQWHAKYIRNQPSERCKLYCQVKSNQYYLLSDKVIDGTPCSLDTFDICVNGHCKAAGCDHILNSTAELDTCGVCKGDNSSCQRITGSYNDSKYGYNTVIKIPAGSSYIDIRQHGWKGSENDSNYLALRNAKGDYILNGNLMVSHHKMIIEPGITMEYSGPESIVERLNSSRPIGIDLILEILSVENIFPPQISYEYTVPKNILASYTWVLSDWSGCNRVCHGIRYRIAECRSTEHKDVVPDDYCQAAEKPREESQSCNTHCNVRWNIISKSECSSHCGPGVRMVASQCTYHYLSGTRKISEHACKHLDRPAEREACLGPCDDAHWLYGEWGACSATCKGGIQARTATCVDSVGQSVPESKCNSQDKVLKRICGQEACPKWALGDWTPCSVSCGIGTRQQAYWCQIENRIVPSGYCSSPPPASEETCDMGPCPSWQTGDWSSCSVTCGEGISQREVTCKTPNGALSSHCNNTIMPPSTRKCKHQSCPVQAIPFTPISDASTSNDYLRPYLNEIDSNKIFPSSITFQPGYKWRTGNFGECSKSCNLGYKNRVVKCSAAESGQIVRDDYCDRNQKPPATMSCNPQACTRWNTGDWSECDSECGAGFKHRQVQCQTERGEVLPDNECSESEKPFHVERCVKAECVEKKPPPRKSHPGVNAKPYRWRVSKWTRCSKSCGNGTKTRRVDCVENSSTGNITPVDERECLRVARRPKSQKPCQRIPCELTWQEGTWSECSAECGNGIQTRAVSCHRANRFGWIDPAPADGCNISERPSAQQACKLRECNDEYHWVAGAWRKCNATCGRKGRQVRRLSCLRRDGKKVPLRFCPPKFKPPRKRKCNQRRCDPISCLEAKKRFKTTKDKEYMLLIGGKLMSIYCHNMTGDYPLEYLTLQSGDHENFAEMYDKRLIDPKTCPFNGQRNDNCNCVEDPSSSSGKTSFQKIRLDPRTLVVAVDDYTFSWTQGARRVEFGKAGDCYSSAACPQGQFSINLERTHLRLAPNLTWVTQGAMTSRVINRISEQKVVGKCGGYCGFCKLETGLKLDVLPP